MLNLTIYNFFFKHVLAIFLHLNISFLSCEICLKGKCLLFFGGEKLESMQTNLTVYKILIC